MNFSPAAAGVVLLVVGVLAALLPVALLYGVSTRAPITPEARDRSGDVRPRETGQPVTRRARAAIAAPAFRFVNPS